MTVILHEMGGLALTSFDCFRGDVDVPVVKEIVQYLGSCHMTGNLEQFWKMIGCFISLGTTWEQPLKEKSIFEVVAIFPGLHFLSGYTKTYDDETVGT